MRMKLKVFRITRNLNQHGMAVRLGYERAYYGHVERGYQKGSAEFWERMQSEFMLTDKEIEELKQND